MKRILLSVMTIALVSGVAFGATKAFFTDTEKSVGNTFTAGTIDISVAGENPWNKTYPMLLDKPSQTNYINFTIQNVGNNSANVWKRINNVETNGGTTAYHCSCASSNIDVSSEPECYEGTNNCKTTYVERDDLDSYMVYDLYVCKGQVGFDCAVEGTEETRASSKPIGVGWTAVIPEINQVRVDNVNGIWIKLNDALAPGEKLAVSQSYHLTAWNDAGEPEITNWAQGDEMKFDIELEARQLTAPAPVTEGSGLLTLQQKNTTTWDIVFPGASGTLTYNVSGATFNYDFHASGLDNVEYSLIYYADPWPGNHPGALIGTHTADGSGNINVTGQIKELNADLPGPADANYPAGAKIWLVPSSAYSSGSQSVTSWGAGKYLFEMNLITYKNE